MCRVLLRQSISAFHPVTPVIARLTTTAAGKIRNLFSEGRRSRNTENPEKIVMLKGVYWKSLVGQFTKPTHSDY